MAVRLLTPAGLIAFGAVGGLALAGGGHAPVAYGIAAVALLGAAAAVVLLAPRPALGALDGTALACLVGLVAWAALSTAWSTDPDASVREAQRGALGVAALGLLLWRGRPGPVLAGVAAAAALTAAAALVAGAPGPVGYANALGVLAAMGAVLALGLAARAPGRAARTGAAATAVLLLAGVAASGSRGALVAVGVGLVVAAALSGGVRRAAATALAAALAAALLVAVPAPAAGPGADVSAAARLRLWSVAAQAAADAPLHGHGAGSFARLWLERRPVPRPAGNAHNLYLETLAELGLPGLLLLAGALGAPLAALPRARRHPLAPAAAGAYAAFLVHAAFDVDWEVPAVTLAALGCGGALLLMARGTAPRTRRPPRAGALAVVLVLLAGSAAGLAAATTLERGREALRAGAYAEAHARADVARRWAPWSAEPDRIAGVAARERGDRAAARHAFARAVARDPGSWAAWRGLAEASRGAARRRAAGRAAALNPFGRR